MKLLGPYYYLENMTDNDYSAIIWGKLIFLVVLFVEVLG